MNTTASEDVLILAIESSCDETAASVVKNGRTVLSNVISSQIATHTVYGGVVPEIASREHIKAINYVIERALTEANVTLEDITAIGVKEKLINCSFYNWLQFISLYILTIENAV